MTLDRRTVVLGTVAAAAVAAAVAVTVLNHSSGESKERRAVTDYIHRVNGIQNDMHAPLTRVLFAYRDFTAKGGPKKNSVTELHKAARTLDRLDRKLAALPAPTEAKQLRRLLLGLVEQQASITREVELMATFTPRFGVALSGARKANSILSSALQGITSPKARKLRGTRKQVVAAQKQYRAQATEAANAQADAVEAYDARITGVIRNLRALRPPQAFAPGYRAQVRALTDVVAAGGALATELRKSDRSRVPVLGRRFTIASREAQSVASQRAQISAIRAYNVRARAVGKAAGRVQTELLRLQKSLP